MGLHSSMICWAVEERRRAIDAIRVERADLIVIIIVDCCVVIILCRKSSCECNKILASVSMHFAKK